MDINEQLAAEFKIRREQVDNTVSLIDDGNTIPFIARYRKEATGALDDQLLRELGERLTYLRNLEQRKSEVSESIEAGGNMTDEIAQSLQNALTLAEVEDIYRPFKPKRKTRATVAKDKGLQPLADFIMEQTLASPALEAEKYIDEEKGVASAEEAIQGAMDIIAETVSDDPAVRKLLAEMYTARGTIVSQAVDAEKESVYTNYYDYSEGVAKIPPHRVLAMDRGEREGILKISIQLDEDEALKAINREYVKAKTNAVIS